MSLLDLIRRRAPKVAATAIPAIGATAESQEPATVAGIATVAVASGPNEEVQRQPAALVAVGLKVPKPHIELAGNPDRSLRARAHLGDGSSGTDAADERYPDEPASERHAARLRRFLAVGLKHDRAQVAADRLAERDADYGDDRRMCGECSYLGARGYCIAARTGRLHGASADLQPVPDLLQRCEAFGLRKGLQ